MFDENLRNQFDNFPKVDVETIHHFMLDEKGDILASFIYDLNPKYFNGLYCIDKEDFIKEYKEKLVNAADAIFDAGISVLPDTKVHLYRAVVLGPDDVEPDLKNPGICWTFNKDTAREWLETNVKCPEDPDYAPCIMEADFKSEDIDWAISLFLQAEEPGEKELRIYKDAEPLRIEYDVL